MPMRSYRRLLAGGFLLGASGPVWARDCSGTVNGHVTDRATQRPLRVAQVRVVGTTRGAATDDAGNYRLAGLHPGTQRIDRNP